jgi:hypothetical protein
VAGMEVSLPDELNMSCLILARYNASDAGMHLKDFDHRISMDKSLSSVSEFPVVCYAIPCLSVLNFFRYRLPDSTNNSRDTTLHRA